MASDAATQESAPASSTQPEPNYAALIAIAVTLSGATIVGWWLMRHLGPISHRFLIPWWLVVPATALGTRSVVRVRFISRESHTVNFAEVPLILAIVFGRPSYVIPAFVAGVTSEWILAHPRMPIHRFVVAIPLAGLIAVLAEAIYRAVLSSASPLGAIGWAATIAAAATTQLVSVLTIVAAVTLALRRPLPFSWSHVSVSWLLPSLINGDLALVSLYVLSADPAAGWLLGLAVALPFIGYRALVKMRQRYSNLELIYTYAKAVGSTLDSGSTQTQILRETAKVMRAKRADLTVFMGNKRAIRTTVDSSGKVWTIPLSEDQCAFERELYLSGRGALVTLERSTGASRQAIYSRDAYECLAAPLRAGEDFTGVLAVSDRADELSHFDNSDLQLFEAMAVHAGIAIRNDQLVCKLRQEAAERDHRARRDSLTALPNRFDFREQLDHALSSPSNLPLAVFLIDLDRFKEVNDTLGHGTGDLLLQEAGRRLQHALQNTGVLARLGGDEFAVLVLHMSASSQIDTIAQRLRAALLEPFAFDELPVEISGSVGISIAPRHGEDAATLMQRAEVAMYAAKSRPDGVAIYSAAIDTYSPRRLALVSELRNAIDRGDLTVYYQPIAEIATGRILSLEALVRWIHPQFGILPPDEFIPIAEHTGLIHPLTTFVLDHALAQLARWRKQGRLLTIAVNLSARNLLLDGFAREIERLITVYAIPPSNLTLELTESSVMADSPVSKATIMQLADIGVNLSIDDFGTGYSSLSYLTHLPIHQIKIDKSFVQNMLTDPNDEIIVRSTLDLARNLGLQCVAEGVENKETWQRLYDMHADCAQGYFLAQPMNAQEFEMWLERYAAPGTRQIIRRARTERGSTVALRVVDSAWAPDNTTTNAQQAGT